MSNTNQAPGLTMRERVEALVETIDQLARARARQQVSEFVGNATGAAYHAETAAKAKELLRKQLEPLI